MKTEYCDIAIIGAGLAGVSCALSATKGRNLNIALIEGNKVGANKSAPLTFADIVNENDLMDCVRGKYQSFAFHNHRGSRIEYVFKDHPLVLLDYEKACLNIFHQIGEKKNSFTFVNHYVRNVSPVGENLTVNLDNEQIINTKVLIDCSGKYIGSSAGKDKRREYFSHPYGAIFSGIQNVRKDLLYFLLPSGAFGNGGGWFYPLNDGRVSFGYATISNSSIMRTEELKNNFYKAVREFEPYSNLLKDARLESVEKGIIPITYKKNLVSQNTIFVGDAAGMATNWTCMGIEPAIKYGKLAGRIAAEAILKDDLSILGAFQEAWDDDNKSTYDQFYKNSATFWNENHYFWEWIIKNDLAYLSPVQLLDRIRRNEHLMKKRQIYLRSLKYKVGILIKKDLARPQNIIIE